MFVHHNTVLKCFPAVCFLLIQLNCCGFTNYTDFVSSEFEKENGGVLPPSCCRTNSTSCSPAEAESSDVEVRLNTGNKTQTTKDTRTGR